MMVSALEADAIFFVADYIPISCRIVSWLYAELLNFLTSKLWL